MGGAVSQDEAGGLLVGHGVGDSDDLFGVGQNMGCKTAKTGERQHAVAHGNLCHTLAKRLNLSGDFTARRKGAGRFHLVHVADDQRVGKVQTGGMNAHAHLAFFRLWRGQFLQNQRLWSSDLFA